MMNIMINHNMSEKGRDAERYKGEGGGGLGAVDLHLSG